MCSTTVIETRNMESEIICLDDSYEQTRKCSASRSFLGAQNKNYVVQRNEINSEEFRRRKKALERARRNNDLVPTVRTINHNKKQGYRSPTKVSNRDSSEDIILLSSSDEDEVERASSPSIITEIAPGSRTILELTNPLDPATQSNKRQRTEDDPEVHNKRRPMSPSAPSVIVEEPETIKSLFPTTDPVNGKKADNDIEIIQRKPGRRVNTTLVSSVPVRRDDTESTSERYLKRLGHLQNRAELVPSQTGKTTSEKIVENLKLQAKERVSVEDLASTKQAEERAGLSSPSAHSRLEQAATAMEGSEEGLVDVMCAVEQFLKTCGDVLPSEEFQSVSKKMKKYVNQISPQLLKSLRLINYIEMKWGLLDSDHNNIYIQIRDVLDELKNSRKDGRSGTTSDLSDTNLGKKKVELTTYKPLRKIPTEESTSNPEVEDDILSILELTPAQSKNTLSKPEVGPSSAASQSFNKYLIERDPISSQPGNSKQLSTENGEKRKSPSKRHVKKLEKALIQCEKQIRKLEETEIDFDEEDSSVYVLQAKYKKRYMDIYRKLAAYNKLSADLDRRADKRFKFEDSRFPGINIKISKFVNRTKQFPDFADVRKLVEEVNIAQKLDLMEVQIHTEAERIFQSVGRKLKTRRGNDDFDSICSYFKESRPIDPATVDSSLEERLQIQGKEGQKKIDKVFEEYVDKQVNRKKVTGKDDSETDADDVDDSEADSRASPQPSVNSPDHSDDCESLSDKNNERMDPEDDAEDGSDIGVEIDIDDLLGGDDDGDEDEPIINTLDDDKDANKEEGGQNIRDNSKTGGAGDKEGESGNEEDGVGDEDGESLGSLDTEAEDVDESLEPPEVPDFPESDEDHPDDH